ncbi:MAG TPA: glycosyltransferase [Acidimicrobiia bacterium]
MTAPPAPGTPEDASTTLQVPAPAVTVAVLAIDGVDIGPALEAVARQAYGPVAVVAVGRARDVPAGVERVGHLPDLLSQLGPEREYLWIVHGDARPRPDALRALVAELERNDAAVAGSKILVEGSVDVLESIGSATDAFGEPFTGLDEDEVDLEQYDVVREVAFVPATSVLIRRDVYKGLAGLDPDMAPTSAGLDLSQRVRLTGGRVIVVPSSEVFHRQDCGHDPDSWRERAGRMRAMLKAYRPVSLIWVAPLAVLADLIDGLGSLLVGRGRTLVDLFKAWGWNLYHLPSLIGDRRSLRRVRAVGDEELFRFQVGGAIRLRRLGGELGERLARAFDQESSDSLAGRVRAIGHRPAIFTSIAALVVLAFATRALWTGHFPAAGMTLPLASTPGDVLFAYSGGWNPAGLGSPQAMPSTVGALSAIQWLLFGKGGFSAIAVTLTALAAALFGFAGLARKLELGLAGGYAAGVAYTLGSALAAVAGAGHWQVLLAAGALPWAVRACLSELGKGRPAIGRVALAGLTCGLVVVFLPAAAVAIVVLVIGLVLAGQASWRAVGRAFAGVGLGLLLLGPSVLGGRASLSLDLGVMPSRLQWWWYVVVIAASLGAILLPEKGCRRVGEAGGLLALSGALVAEIVTVPAVADAALLVAAFGTGLLVTALLAPNSGRAWLRVAAASGAWLVVAGAIPALVGGRAGLPPDAWSDRLDFVATLSSAPGTERTLVIGMETELPGTSRQVFDFEYRLVTGSPPTLDEAQLPEAAAGDGALEDALRVLAEAGDLRPGAALAPFAVRWVVVLDSVTALDEGLARQVDLAPRPVDPTMRVYENTAFLPRGQAGEEVSWGWDGRGYSGDPVSGEVRLAENSDGGWGPEAAVDDWAMTVSGSEGEARYSGGGLGRALAVGSGVWLVAMAGLAIWGRRR